MSKPSRKALTEDAIMWELTLDAPVSDFARWILLDLLHVRFGLSEDGPLTLDAIEEFCKTANYGDRAIAEEKFMKALAELETKGTITYETALYEGGRKAGFLMLNPAHIPLAMHLTGTYFDGYPPPPGVSVITLSGDAQAVIEEHGEEKGVEILVNKVVKKMNLGE